VPGPLLQSQPSRPTGQIPLAPEHQGDRAVHALHCRWTAHRRRAHGTAVALGLVLPTFSPPYHLRRPPPRLICRCRSKPIPSLILCAPHCSLCSVTLKPTLHGTASHQRPPTSAASSTTVPVCQVTPVTKPSFIREPDHHAPRIAEAVTHPPPSSTDTSPLIATSGPSLTQPPPP
jgi:hypothetical protein